MCRAAVPMQRLQRPRLAWRGHEQGHDDRRVARVEHEPRLVQQGVHLQHQRGGEQTFEKRAGTRQERLGLDDDSPVARWYCAAFRVLELQTSLSFLHIHTFLICIHTTGVQASNASTCTEALTSSVSNGPLAAPPTDAMAPCVPGRQDSSSAPRRRRPSAGPASKHTSCDAGVMPGWHFA